MSLLSTITGAASRVISQVGNQIVGNRADNSQLSGQALNQVAGQAASVTLSNTGKSRAASSGIYRAVDGSFEKQDSEKKKRSEKDSTAVMDRGQLVNMKI